MRLGICAHIAPGHAECCVREFAPGIPGHKTIHILIIDRFVKRIGNVCVLRDAEAMKEHVTQFVSAFVETTGMTDAEIVKNLGIIRLSLAAAAVVVNVSEGIGRKGGTG